MNQQQFLNGKVRKISLPTFSGPLGPDAPHAKRLLLPQGELAQFTDGSEPLRYIAALQLRAGTIRGNHYHLQKHESLYLFSGEITLHLGDPNSTARDRLHLAPGDLAIIPPGIAHALTVVRDGFAIEFSPEPFDLADTHRFQLT